jgi:hypothetical protein
MSARRLRGITTILAPGTSVLLAWAAAPLDRETIAMVAPAPDAQLLVLGFNPTKGGTVLEVA